MREVLRQQMEVARYSELIYHYIQHWVEGADTKLEKQY